MFGSIMDLVGIALFIFMLVLPGIVVWATLRSIEKKDALNEKARPVSRDWKGRKLAGYYCLPLFRRPSIAPDGVRVLKGNFYAIGSARTALKA